MDEHERLALETTLARWRERLHQRGLTGAVDALLTAAAPLAPLGAQLLYIAEPVLGLLNQRPTVTRWATLLEEPGSIDWLRDQLTQPTVQPGATNADDD